MDSIIKELSLLFLPQVLQTGDRVKSNDVTKKKKKKKPTHIYTYIHMYVYEVKLYVIKITRRYTAVFDSIRLELWLFFKDAPLYSSLTSVKPVIFCRE